MASARSERVMSTLRVSTVACTRYKRFEHRIRECEERGAEKGAMLVKLNVLPNSEMGPMAAMVGEARGGSKEGWKPDSGATVHISYTHAGRTLCKKASPGTTVEVADGNILPVDAPGTPKQPSFYSN